MNKKKKSKIILGLLIAVVTLGIGYAAIAGVSLLINGTSSVKSSDGNFNVRFVKNEASETAIENPTVNAIKIAGKALDESDLDTSSMTASITDDTHATFNAGALSEVGSYAEFTYTVVNESEGIDAMLSFDINDTNDTSDYFEITKSADKSVISEGETSNVKVKVKLINTPKVSDVEGNFTLTLTATPVEEEDLSSSISGTTQEVNSASSFAKAVQNNNIDTIELKDDVTIDKKTNLTINENTTIDFKGNTLTVESGSIKVAEGAKLTLKDDNETGGIKSTSNAILLQNGGEVVVQSGSYETTEFSNKGAVINIPSGVDNAKVTVNGGTIAGKYFAISSWGNNDIEINGGDISSTASSVLDKEDGKSYYAYAVKLTEGHLDLNNGSITGVHGGLAVEGSATATINGGSITLNNRGTNDSYYLFYVIDGASVEVKDGTFTNNGTRSLVYSTTSGSVDIKGGSWTGKSTYPFNNKKNGGTDSIKIYGGTFNKNASGNITEYDVSAYRVN